MSKLMHVTDDDFQAKVLDHKSPVLVDFWAEWCGPCKMIAPVLDDLAAELAGKVTIGKINIDENPNIPTKYSIRGIPTLLLFKNGEMVGSKVGLSSKSVLKEWVESLI